MKNQKGFSVLEVLLLIIIVIGLSAAGYYVYSQGKDAATDDTPKTTVEKKTSKTDATESKPVDRKEKWLRYDAPDGKYSLRLPDGWSLEVEAGGSAPYTMQASNIMFKDGVPAVVQATNYAGDISHVAFSMNDTPEGFFGQDPKGAKQKTFSTNQGLEVSRYDFTEGSRPVLYPSGMTRYEYRINSNGKTFQVIHDVLRGETAQTDLVEESLKTLELK